MTSMTASGPAPHNARTLDIPGVRLYYEVRGSGPMLLIIGAPMASGFFTELAELLATEHTVLTYDPKGISRSTLTGLAADDTPVTRAQDVYRLIEAMGGWPVDVFGSSGGAVTGLALVQHHPELVRTLVAHEPPLVDLLVDAAQHRAWGRELHRIWQREGPDVAFGAFLAGAGFDRAPRTGIESKRADGPDSGAPFPTSTQESRANNDYFFGHMMIGTPRYVPDATALRAASTRVVIGVGSTSPDQLTHRTALATAEFLGTSAVPFPGDHGGFLTYPQEFAAVLRQTLDR